MTAPFGTGRPVFVTEEETQDMSIFDDPRSSREPLYTISDSKYHKGKVLPAGIRMRNEKFFVDVTRDGVRKTATCLSLKEAKAKRDSLLSLAAAGPLPPQPWTFKEAFDATWKGKQPNKAYRLGLQALAYFGPNSRIDDVKTADMDDYVDHLRLKGNGPATINRKLSAISMVLTCALYRNKLDTKPHIPWQKEPAGKTRFLTGEEEKRLLWSCASSETRDFVSVLLDTGMRVSEALRLCYDDVSDGRATVWTSKNGRPRTIPLPARTDAIIKRRAVEYSVDNLPVFYSSRASYERAFRAACKAAGPAFSDVTLHTLRHTCASRLAQRGVPLRAIMEWMGHKSINTTMRYAHLDTTSLDSAREALDR